MGKTSENRGSTLRYLLFFLWNGTYPVCSRRQCRFRHLYMYILDRYRLQVFGGNTWTAAEAALSFLWRCWNSSPSQVPPPAAAPSQYTVLPSATTGRQTYRPLIDYLHTNNTQNDTKQQIHRTTQQFGRVRAVPRLGELYPGICLTTEEKAGKNLSQGSRV